jgi:hypothetical protein
MATIITKNSQTASAVPSAASLSVGELAVNTADGKLYTEHTGGVVKEIIPSTVVDGGITANKLASNSVTTAKIVDANVTVAKLSATGTPSSSTFLRGDGSWQAAGGGGGRGQAFTSNGTFTIPAGVTALKVTVVGGGGNSGPAETNFYTFGIGGGGGGAAIKYLTSLTSGNTLSVTVGGAGGTSSVASGTQSITTISATGGATGGRNPQSPICDGALGGSGSNGDININGGGSTAGYLAYETAVLSTGGNSIFGSTQRSRTRDSQNNYLGENAINYGCGGSGPFRYNVNQSASSGFQGIVIFEW